MNKDIKSAYKRVRAIEEELADAIEDLRIAIEFQHQEKVTFENGKVIVNGVEYPVSNFTVEWKHKDDTS